jgi:addiction module HigA family antidote
MMKNNMRPIHPGEQLQDELEELGMSGKEFAGYIDVPANRINEILRGRRGITADTALRLARYFGTTPEFWMNLQSAFEIRTAEIEAGKAIRLAVKPRAA